MATLKANGSPQDMAAAKRRYNEMTNGKKSNKNKPTSGNSSKQAKPKAKPEPKKRPLNDAEKVALLEMMAAETVCQLRREFRKAVK